MYTLDDRILAALIEGPCTLPVLTDRVTATCGSGATGIDARAVLKRLHVLGGLRNVSCRLEDGAQVWCIGQRAATRAEPAIEAEPSKPVPSPLQSLNRAAVTRRSPRRATTKGGEDTSAEVTPPANSPTRPASRERKKLQPIIVRPRQRVLELRVMPINNGDAIIQAESDDEGGELEEIFVPNADIPALIRALTEAMVA